MPVSYHPVRRPYNIKNVRSSRVFLSICVCCAISSWRYHEKCDAMGPFLLRLLLLLLLLLHVLAS